MSDAGDDLLAHIRAFTRGRVPPNLEEIVTELVGRTVVLVMTTPAFYHHLKPIMELQQENWNLRQALIAYQRAEQVRTQRARPRKAPAKAARKAPAPPVRKTTARKKAPPSNVRAFKRGAGGR